MMEMDGRRVTDAELASLGLYNYGHFTSMRLEEMRVRGLPLHLERLTHDCRVLFGTDLDLDLVRRNVRQAAQNLASPVVVRVTVFDPGIDLGHPATAASPRVLVTARPAATGELPPLRVQPRVYARELPTVKHTGLLGTIHQRRLAQIDGFDDAVFIDTESSISEGATWNIGFFDGERVVWPESDRLPGVTMLLLKEILRHRGIESVNSQVKLSDIPHLRAAFITNAAVGVRPIREIGEFQLDSGVALLGDLQKEYLALRGDPL